MCVCLQWGGAFIFARYVLTSHNSSLPLQLKVFLLVSPRPFSAVDMFRRSEPDGAQVCLTSFLGLKAERNDVGGGVYEQGQGRDPAQKSEKRVLCFSGRLTRLDISQRSARRKRAAAASSREAEDPLTRASPTSAAAAAAAGSEPRPPPFPLMLQNCPGPYRAGHHTD